MAPSWPSAPARPEGRLSLALPQGASGGVTASARPGLGDRALRRLLARRALRTASVHRTPRRIAARDVPGERTDLGELEEIDDGDPAGPSPLHRRVDGDEKQAVAAQVEEIRVDA